MIAAAKFAIGCYLGYLVISIAVTLAFVAVLVVGIVVLSLITSDRRSKK